MTGKARLTQRLDTALTSVRIQARSEAALMRARLSGRRALLHHGLQRSGTNYLLLSLLRLGVPVINYRDPPRDHPRHKHCRWQHDKTTLIPPVAAQYGNSYQVTDLDELDAICGLAAGTPHMVLIKERSAWLKSICNWGLSCGWFADKNDALAHLSKLGADYDAYVAFWSDFEDRFADRVAVLKYAQVAKGAADFFDALHRLGFDADVRLGALKIDKVPRSPTQRAEVVDMNDVESTLASRG